MTKLEEAVEFGEKAVRARDHMANRLREYAAEISEMREQETKTYAELTDRSRRDVSIHTTPKLHHPLITQHYNPNTPSHLHPHIYTITA